MEEIRASTENDHAFFDQGKRIQILGPSLGFGGTGLRPGEEPPPLPSRARFPCRWGRVHASEARVSRRFLGPAALPSLLLPNCFGSAWELLRVGPKQDPTSSEADPKQLAMEGEGGAGLSGFPSPGSIEYLDAFALMIWQGQAEKRIEQGNTVGQEGAPCPGDVCQDVSCDSI